MKKTKFSCFSFLCLCLLLVGCSNKDGTFTITCTTPKDKNGNITSETSITYKFNKKQLVTEYTATTIQTFKDKKTYEVYKKAQEESVKGNSNNESVKYSLNSNDKAKQLEFKYTVLGLDKKASTKEDKNTIKASTILKRNEDTKAKCILKGISKNKIK